MVSAWRADVGGPVSAWRGDGSALAGLSGGVLGSEGALLCFADLFLHVFPGDVDALSTGAGVGHHILAFGMVEQVGQMGTSRRYFASAGMHSGCAPHGAT